jgi:predicted GH43/DUF377 family glycosyl hydrolase
MFIPGEEELIQGTSRVADVVERCLQLDESDVLSSLEDIKTDFYPRHRDFPGQFEIHARAVGHLIPSHVSPERRAFIGACLTQEYSFEAAAYFNPCLVAHPDQHDTPSDALRVLMSVRAVGEGHISTIVFRAGMIHATGDITIDPASNYASTRAHRFTILRRRVVQHAAVEHGVDTADLELILAMLPDKFTPEELSTSLSQFDVAGLRRTPSHALLAAMESIMHSSYEVDFPDTSELSERVLWPTAAEERRGMEDARFVRIQEMDAPVRYRGTYTAFDGTDVRSRIIETDDFRTFSSLSLSGKAARNKGLAFFPRHVSGRLLALSRWDRESISIAQSDDGYHWDDVSPIRTPEHSWEVVHIGNCGSPIETSEGWLVLTHGAGPIRRYCIGAMLLDRDDPSKVLGHLPTPLLEPTGEERDGYVPNVLYSCGSVIHGDHLVIPYGVSDYRTRFATVSVSELLDTLI